MADHMLDTLATQAGRPRGLAYILYANAAGLHRI